MRLIHHFAQRFGLMQPFPVLQNVRERLNARVFVNRVTCGAANVVNVVRLDCRYWITDAAIQSQELLADHLFRQTVDEMFLEFRWSYISQITIPSVPGGVDNDAIAHERRGAHSAVIRAADRMSNAGIKPPNS